MDEYFLKEHIIKSHLILQYLCCSIYGLLLEVVILHFIRADHVWAL